MGENMQNFFRLSQYIAAVLTGPMMELIQDHFLVIARPITWVMANFGLGYYMQLEKNHILMNMIFKEHASSEKVFLYI